MFSHIFISVTDFERALRFYTPLMDSLGLVQRFCDADKPWAGWHSPVMPRPLFVICTPYDGQAHHPGNGQMVAFAAPSRASVRAAHATALAHGGTDEGAPGLRPHYHADYYGAYFRDPDGNKLCVACHAPEPAHPPSAQTKA
jgi:lactoylglutathione lyase